MPVDLYVGGAEHAVLHLLYSRFWHKVLFDRGIVSMPEPFQKLVNQGMILGENNEKMSQEPAATSSIPTRSSPSTAPIRSASTKCSWARSKPRNLGACRASTACIGFLNRVWRLIIDDRAEANATQRRDCRSSAERR